MIRRARRVVLLWLAGLASMALLLVPLWWFVRHVMRPVHSRVTLACVSRGEHPRILVRDTGPGLTEADLKGIWKRYTRGSAASASTPGLGLGLALVRAIAHAHGGQAGGGTAEGGGAEFWIDVPVGEPAETAQLIPGETKP